MKHTLMKKENLGKQLQQKSILPVIRRKLNFGQPTHPVGQ